MYQNEVTDFQKIAEFYDEFASEYFKSRLISGGRLFNEYIEMPAVNSLIPQKMKAKRVLDIGCGIGVYSRLLATKGAKVTAIDISTKMIEIAQNTCAGLNVNFENISFQDFSTTKKFDLIIGGFMLGYFYDLRGAFHKIEKLMHNNSSCILSMLHPVKLSSVERADAQYVLDNYFDENSMYQSDFMSSEKEIPLKKWNFTDISEAAKKERLYIDQILEPTPQNTPITFDKKTIDFYCKCPSVLIVKFKKREIYEKRR
jgi:2-polyprenyl-3-methyl-5-hydroxy-6-metoxy-1,4-benzoquinol methylase